MENDFQKLEDELSRLRPIGLSPTVRLGIERRLGRPATPVIRLWWFGAAAAAALAVTFALHRRPGGAGRSAAVSPDPAVVDTTAAFLPVSAVNVMLHARDEGVVLLSDGTPARQQRQLFVDTITWRNPRTNASLQWTVPREEVQVLPIAYQ